MNSIPPFLRVLITVLGVSVLITYLTTYGPIQTRKTPTQLKNEQAAQNAPEETTITKSAPLKDAMMADPQVSKAADTLIATPPREFTRYMHALQNLIFTWTGTADLPMDSRGEWIDARKLAAMEHIQGKPMRFAPDDRTDPMKYQSRLIMQGWWAGVLYPIGCPFLLHSALDNMSLAELYNVVEQRFSAPHQMSGRAGHNLKTVVAALRPEAGADSAEYRGYLSFVLHCMTHAQKAHIGQTVFGRHALPPPEEFLTGIEIILDDADVPFSVDYLLKVQFVVDDIDNKFDRQNTLASLSYFLTIPYAKVFLPLLCFMILAVYVAGLARRRKQEKPR